jgi:hypothetical protein
MVCWKCFLILWVASIVLHGVERSSAQDFQENYEARCTLGGGVVYLADRLFGIPERFQQWCDGVHMVQ